ncbi:MAG TPA: metalloregulator ArsR/SmtB family transcription factor [Bryobacteraceae bacterium]|nr:metalloregulator ArsR/SmtB family transcription factor [Bryobacteraceae bacterium]
MPRSSQSLRALKGSAPIFAALGDETRLAIVSRLSSGGPRSINALTEGSAVTRQAVTKHLHILAGAGLVSCSPRGRERIWELDSRRLAQAQHYLAEISKHWDAALDRLRTFVED